MEVINYMAKQFGKITGPQLQNTLKHAMFLLVNSKDMGYFSKIPAYIDHSYIVCLGGHERLKIYLARSQWSS